MQDSEFIAEYEGLVRKVAEQTRAQLSLRCEIDDLLGFGYQGLLEARARFDAERGVQFRTFAHYRVRGAILDGVRAMAYLPRRAYARLKAAEALDGEGEALAEASASAEQRATDVTGGLRTLDAVLGRVAAAYTVALGSEDDEPAQASPEEALLRNERRDVTREAIASLSEQERHIVEGHYVHGQSLDELGKQLGMSKSWASRMHSRALERLRHRLRSKL